MRAFVLVATMFVIIVSLVLGYIGPEPVSGVVIWRNAFGVAVFFLLFVLLLTTPGGIVADLAYSALIMGAALACLFVTFKTTGVHLVPPWFAMPAVPIGVMAALVVLWVLELMSRPSSRSESNAGGH